MIVNGKALECVQSAIHLGVTISSDLRWNRHVNASVKRAAKRLHFLVQLKEQNYLIVICCFIACLSSVLRYAVLVFYQSLPLYLKRELEQIQERA